MIWFVGLSCELLLKIFGLVYWSSPIGLNLLILRDVVFGLLALSVWSILNHRILPDTQKFLQSKTRSKQTNRVFLAFFLGLTLSYFLLLFGGAFSPAKDSVFFNLLFPLKMLTYIFFQQTTITLLLFDICRKYLSRKNAAVFTSLIFGLTHLAAVFNVELIWAVVLTLLASGGMCFWLIIRKKTASLSWPMLIHYFFWIIVGTQLPLFD
ncbi:hypothetical protein NO1_1257 [Candidatus Termititenax aidoneus]|uniref:Uncharacterized protein n=1 Tax=Termititenax aidoneus TaxID=2218524 RepID=A0A388TB57_TERA1|nr:hypothetical protein NO1_1257 [Candidatus Termititenax aidoneus]